MPFSRGALFHLLRSPICIGRIPHKNVVHQGSHGATLAQDVFDRVQGRLDGQFRRHRSKGERRVARAPLIGRLFDAAGKPMSPTFCRGRTGRTYRYYVSAALQQGSRDKDDTVRRLPAPAFEKLVSEVIGRWLPFAGAPLDIPLAIRLQDQGVLIDMPGSVSAEVATRLGIGERIVHAAPLECRIEVLHSLPLRGGKRQIIPGSRSTSPDRSLIAALRRALYHQLTRRFATPGSGPCIPLRTRDPASRVPGASTSATFLKAASRQPSALSDCATWKYRCAGPSNAGLSDGLNRREVQRRQDYPAARLINSLPALKNSLPEITGNLQPPHIANRLEYRRISGRAKVQIR